MKYVLMLVITLYQVDSAFAGSGDIIDLQKIEDHLQKAAQLNVFSLRALPRPADAATPVPQAPLSCDVKIQSQREKIHMDYDCDAIKTLKKETFSLAAN